MFYLKTSGEVDYGADLQADSVPAAFRSEVRFFFLSVCVSKASQPIFALNDLSPVIVPVRLFELRSAYESN